MNVNRLRSSVTSRADSIPFWLVSSARGSRALLPVGRFCYARRRDIRMQRPIGPRSSRVRTQRSRLGSDGWGPGLLPDDERRDRKREGLRVCRSAWVLVAADVRGDAFEARMAVVPERLGEER